MNPKNYIILGKKELNKEKFKFIKNRIGLNKPEGGLWASPYYPNREYISGWHEWCINEQEDDWVSNDSVVLELKDDTKIYTINNQKDLIEFIGIVEIAKNELTLKMGLRFASPDFEKAAQKFDVIYLTEEGQRKTRFSDDQCDYNMYGWDCESILILNFDCIKKWEYKKLNIMKEDN